MLKIIHQEVVDLANLLSGTDRESRANCLYIIRHNGVPYYVGKTVRGARRRVQEHLNADDIGRLLYAAAPRYQGWTVEIWHIESMLAEAEQTTIKSLQPILNIQRSGRYQK